MASHSSYATRKHERNIPRKWDLLFHSVTLQLFALSGMEIISMVESLCGLFLLCLLCVFFLSLFLGHKSIRYSFMFTKMVSQNAQNFAVQASVSSSLSWDERLVLYFS